MENGPLMDDFPTKTSICYSSQSQSYFVHRSMPQPAHLQEKENMGSSQESSSVLCGAKNGLGGLSTDRKWLVTIVT